MIRKKAASEIDPALLTEPELSKAELEEYVEGWRLFNERRFWDAHEAWENVWKGRHEESRIFFQGIIQLAAAYHLLLVHRRFGGMMRNFEKAEEKLQLFPSRFLHVDVHSLLQAIADARTETMRVSPQGLAEFNISLIPVVHLTGITSRHT